MESITVIIADDHPVVLAGTSMALQEAEDIEIIALARNGREALTLAMKHEPDVLLLDIRMPGLSGVTVAEHLEKQGSPVKVLALSAYEDEAYIYGILDAGAAGYLLKEEADTETIVEAIRGVARGDDEWISPGLAARLLRRRRRSSSLDALTTRELEILKKVARGLSNAEIGEQLSISKFTVKNHIDHIKSKLEVRTRAELIVWAWEHGIVKKSEG